MAVINKQAFNSQPQKKRGPLVRVEIGKGQFRKMYQEDAITQGYIKSKPAAENKMIQPAENKMAQPTENKLVTKPLSMPAEPPRLDDFTAIPGIGRATARALQARGIATFEQLKAAGSLDYVSAAAMQAIEQWRQNG